MPMPNATNHEPPPDATNTGLTCACGSPPDPAEPPTHGLYYADDGSLAYICLPCWQAEALGLKRPN